MSTTPHSPETESSQDESHWAKPVSGLKVSDVPSGVNNLNVEGRQVVGPLQGFGQLWQKTYRARFGSDVTPTEVVKVWKETLPDLMPAGSRFYPSMAGVQPGEILLINATMPGMPPGMTVSTGVMILYVDDVSFTVMTPEGHPESGFNTFSAYEDDDGETVAQIQSLARANDPIFEFGFRFMGFSAHQEKIWQSVLTSLASQFDLDPQVETNKVCVDSRVQWSQAKNVWHNSVIRTTLNAPLRLGRRLFKRG